MTIVEDTRVITGGMDTHAALSGRAAGAPKGRDGAVEAIRALMVAKRSARAERTQAINQARALIVTGPDDLRARFAGLTAAALAEAIAALRPRPGDAVEYAVRIALREQGVRRRGADGGEQYQRLARVEPGHLQRGDVPVATLLAEHVDGVPEHQVRLAGPGQVGVGGGERAAGGARSQRRLAGQFRRFGQAGRAYLIAQQRPVHLVDGPLPRPQDLRRRATAHAAGTWAVTMSGLKL